MTDAAANVPEPQERVMRRTPRSNVRIIGSPSIPVRNVMVTFTPPSISKPRHTFEPISSNFCWSKRRPCR